MARLARVVLPDHPHHVTQRGNHGQKVFFRSQDYRTYIDLLIKGCTDCGTKCWAYCLMPNHVHLVLVPVTMTGLKQALAQVHTHYARRINRRYDRKGHLWQQRYYSSPMDEPHLFAAVRYVELNPVRGALVDQPQRWRWSSARAHIANSDDTLVTVAPMLERVADWQEYLGTSNDLETDDAIRRLTRSGRPLGSETFVKTAERLTGRPLLPRKRGRKPKQA